MAIMFIKTYCYIPCYSVRPEGIDLIFVEV